MIRTMLDVEKLHSEAFADDSGFIGEAPTLAKCRDHASDEWRNGARARHFRTSLGAPCHHFIVRLFTSPIEIMHHRAMLAFTFAVYFTAS